MPTVRYTVVDGEILSELRGGVKRDYVPDPLGSTVALLDASQNITDTFSYWPYGESAGRTGTTATPFQYVGTMGYYTDSSGRNYVRARYLDKGKGRWVTKDPLQLLHEDNFYQYVNSRPAYYTDPSGLIEIPPWAVIWPEIVLGAPLAGWGIVAGTVVLVIGGISVRVHAGYLHTINDKLSHCWAMAMGMRVSGWATGIALGSILALIGAAAFGLPGLIIGGLVGLGLGYLIGLNLSIGILLYWAHGGHALDPNDPLDDVANSRGISCGRSFALSPEEECARLVSDLPNNPGPV